ncbi:MAG: hypothetical protein ACSHX6_05190 [Akkermansiaceae bacterium]
MKLSLSGKKVAATEELIQKVVHDQGYRDEFFILINDENEYVYLQATGPNEALHVEYRDGVSEDDHFVCTSQLSCDELEQLCLSYFKGDVSALQNYEWCRIADYNRDGGGGVGGWSISGL